jgi:serine protease
MNFGTRAWCWAARGGVAAIVVVAASAGTQAAATAAPATPATAAPAAVASGSPTTDPYAPAYHHAYRRGAVPTLGAAAQMASWAGQHPAAAADPTAFSPAASPAAAATSVNNVNYGGGDSTDGIGVTTGDERVFLVFFGSQWGTQTTSGPNMIFSNDPSGEAPYVQDLFRGLGTGNDEWSGLMTQYCQNVAAGRQTCPASAPHVAYPHSGALAGVWYDNSAKSPAKATGDQLGQAAIAAAAHFGNTTPAANRDASYVILSPHGTDPDQYKQGDFCAWHDYTGDPGLDGSIGALSPPYIPFTNMPYVTDVGASCGENFVRSGQAGLLDGVSIVVGHEYAETITDQEPPAGWVDSSGEEVADKCAWKQTGDGKVALLSLPTGTFAMQGIWANNASGGQGGCRFSQTIKTTQLLQNPGFESGTLAGWNGTPPGVLHKSTKTNPAHAGSWLALLTGSESLSQQVTVAPPVVPPDPGGGTYGAATFSFWLKIKTSDTGKKADDTLTVQEVGEGGTVALKTFSNLNAGSGYVQYSFTLSPASFMHNGQPVPVTLQFVSAQKAGSPSTSFLIDDTALNAS